MTISNTTRGVAVRVLLFAQLRGRLGPACPRSFGGAGRADELVVSLPEGSSGRDLMRWCIQRDPATEGLLSVARLAVNGEYVSWERVLQDGDEVVIIPPVSGG